MKPLPNRLAVYATALGALAAGLLPLVGNLDWQSTAGILAAILAITGVVSVWLYNWGKYERASTITPAIARTPQGTTYTPASPELEGEHPRTGPPLP